jgi:SAM (Sterile alpha motif) domain-containing protein
VEATVDVAAWLKNLGLGQYEAAFRDNAIDGDLLPSLTAEDLKDLGVTIVGHRRKLLDAIAALGAASKPAAPSPPAALPASTTSRPSAEKHAPPHKDAAERRPITVMFCDLVGSTALAAKLDAEDWRSLVNAYLDEASRAVTGLGGHVLKKLGDGLMASLAIRRRRKTMPNEGCAPRSRSSARSKASTREMRKGGRRRSPRASASIPGRSWSIRRARCSARRPISPRAFRVLPSRVQFS